MTTIICGIDGSPGARSALRVAAELAERLSARLVAVHVRARSTAHEDVALRVAADLVAQEVPHSGAQARGATGDVARCLATIARSEDAAMIVLGARRRGRSRAFLRARSAVGLLGLTGIPVLVAPLPAGSAAVSPAAGPAANAADDGTPKDPVRAAATAPTRRRRPSRTTSGSLRPAWSRGPFQGGRTHT